MKGICKMKKTILVALVGAMAAMFSGCAGCDRVGKSIGSDFGGGLHRTVTVYSNTGEKIKGTASLMFPRTITRYISI
mgnify:CR=1 FL=1